jgi:hypothetical protein
MCRSEMKKILWIIYSFRKYFCVVTDKEEKEVEEEEK